MFRAPERTSTLPPRFATPGYFPAAHRRDGHPSKDVPWRRLSRNALYDNGFSELDPYCWLSSALLSKKLAWIDAKEGSDLESLQSEIALATFDRTEVGAMNTHVVGECLLAEAVLQTIAT